MPDLHLSTDTGLADVLGIEFETIEPERAVATMPVTPRHHQPFGYLHGGATVALAETVASVGATTAALPEKVAFGLEINANHVRPVREGTLRAVGERLYAGRTTQVWEVRVFDERERLICVSRCTLALVDPKSGPSGETR
ncbi:MAG: hotdog fold thioesterase [Rhodothermales bacterium]|nr:hotdog fold thioesterase [Rhodothermales bacterium]